MTIDQTTANVLTDLLRELSSELDLHYEDEDFHALKPTIKTLRRAGILMMDAGHDVPEVYHHVMGRFERATRSQDSDPTAEFHGVQPSSSTGLSNMSEPFDPNISSSKYLAVARERHRAGTTRLREELAWMLDDEAYDCGLNREHVYVLTNPLNWSAAVRNANWKARVFLDARINQRGNAEIGWTRGDHEILYDEDFLARYADAAQRHDAVPWRSLGELMWWKGYEMMASHAILRQSPSATALLYAHAARLNDLATYLARHVTLVGAVTINFTYDEGHLSSVDFVPTIPPERMQEITQERRRRTGERMREAVERLVPKENDPE